MADSTWELELGWKEGRPIRVVFDEGPISTDGGALLIQQVEARLGLIPDLAAAFGEHRAAGHIRHSVKELLGQRIFGIVQGYEDCNDAAFLRHDPVFKTLCGRDPVKGQELASQPTLSRLENGADSKSCYRMAETLLESYFVRHPSRPKRLVLDLDLTDDPTHGRQQLTFFNAFYDEHCYLPLLVFDGAGDLLTAVLLPGKPQGVGPVVAVLERIIQRLRKQWPGVDILVRADSHFAAPGMYRLCHKLKVHLLLGIGPNKVLKRLAARLQRDAKREHQRTGEKARLFSSTRYRARHAKKRWPRTYRVIIKAEHSNLGPNVRFVITDLPGRAEALYARYVERGESCENSIKDFKNVLKADRLSCHRFLANQFRLLLHAAAYVLLFALRQLAHGTELAHAQMDTIRLKLLKVAVRVESSVRRIWFHLTSSHPWQHLWRTVAMRAMAPSPFG